MINIKITEILQILRNWKFKWKCNWSNKAQLRLILSVIQPQHSCQLWRYDVTRKKKSIANLSDCRKNSFLSTMNLKRKKNSKLIKEKKICVCKAKTPLTATEIMIRFKPVQFSFTVVKLVKYYNICKKLVMKNKISLREKPR